LGNCRAGGLGIFFKFCFLAGGGAPPPPPPHTAGTLWDKFVWVAVPTKLDHIFLGILLI